MTRRSVVLRAPRRVEVVHDDLPAPRPGELAVRSLVSGISAGTELHFYRGELPEGLPLDEGLDSLAHSLSYPLAYGYACVGESQDGRRVFSFQPHVSHFAAAPDALYEVPEEVDTDAAVLWPTAETAVNLVLDGKPLVGERVLVVGQGLVGLATTALLSRYPLGRLWSVDPLEPRRDASMACGASRTFHPNASEALRDFDLAFELSGTAAGLNLAIGAVGLEGRVVAGSWYGGGEIPVALGTHFHRGRVHLVSSQVSRIGAELRARWDKRRRMHVAAELLADLACRSLISHRFPVDEAPLAFELIDKKPEDCLQVVLTYT